MRRYAARLISNALAAVAGAAFGNALHQRLRSPGDESGTAETVAIPVVNSLAATLAGFLVGAVFGRRGWIVAFGIGAIASAVFGRALDRRVLPAAQTASASDTSSSHSSG